MSRSLFFYGTLRDIPLLEIVLGKPRAALDIAEASLPDYAVFWVQDQPFPMITARAGAVAHGLVLRGASAEDVDRLQYYEGGFDYDLTEVEVDITGQTLSASVFFPQPGLWPQGAPWSLADWQAQWGKISRSAAREVIALFGSRSAAEVAHLLPFLRARGWAHQLAETGDPASLRRDMPASAVSVAPRDGGYAGFFRLDTFSVSYPRFDGSRSETVERAAFIAYDAALLLPYDPVTDQVLLIEQMRYGPLMRGDPLPWVLEPVAGLVDAGEAPIETARREAVEEAALAVSDIRPMMRAYASPGYSTEYFHYFLGLCDLNGRSGGLGGLPSEHEDIRSHIISFDRAMALVESGEINQSPLIVMLLWLARERQALRLDAARL